jgi:alpha-amylase/alpha-mannosidase (GH57 family)
MEAGAAPFPNWNERILSECYRPNARLGNFEHISFNLGPTLFEWMAARDTQTCQQIVAQDQANLRHFGVGNALAQPYHHTILPLASNRDKRTQVAWGITQFEHRFGRKPQGMWLPEAAVDTQSLSILADQGIQFTILAPWQADASGLDVTEPYRVYLPEGRSITVFFYHSDLSGGISFNPGMTVNADLFAKDALRSHFRPDKIQRGEPQMLLLASDGELYGHHQPLRDHFLAHLVNGAASKAGLTPTFPALWLMEHPPRQSVRIREDTSWSCHHGVERWKGACGCVPGDQLWKKYLRHAVDRLSRRLDALYAHSLSAFIPDPWSVRDAYIRVVLGLQPVGDLIAEMAGKRLPEDDTLRIKLLLEAQYQRHKMYASCGWFFDDFDRIEPRNCVAYATSAILLAHRATGVNLTASFREDLHHVVSARIGLRGDQVLNDLLRRTASISN